MLLVQKFCGKCVSPPKWNPCLGSTFRWNKPRHLDQGAVRLDFSTFPGAKAPRDLKVSATCWNWRFTGWIWINLLQSYKTGNLGVPNTLDLPFNIFDSTWETSAITGRSFLLSRHIRQLLEFKESTSPTQWLADWEKNWSQQGRAFGLPWAFHNKSPWYRTAYHSNFLFVHEIPKYLKLGGYWDWLILHSSLS